MNRRDFLLNTARLALGGLLGFGSIPSVLAAPLPVSDTGYRARIALIIDDIGASRIRTRQFLAIGVPLTFAVLPRLSFSRDLAAEIYDAGHEVMLHQPMEPFNGHLDPGPGALYVGDSPERIARVVEQNLIDVPFAMGVNNHMGSRFTASRPEIRAALETVASRGLFFVDSVTSCRSVAYDTAVRLPMITAQRDVFIDNCRSTDAVYQQLLTLEEQARRYGQALGIGHPYPWTAAALARFARHLQESPVSLIPMSGLLAL